jgi:hypothetical protein
VIAPNQTYTSPDGSKLRVDLVKDGQVYFVSWRPDQKYGCPIRMPVETFKRALVTHGMELDD